MAKTVKPIYISKALVGCLEEYRKETQDAVNAAGEKAMKRLVKITRKTAPQAPKSTGDFARKITSITRENAMGDQAHVWCVKAPEYRLTHLIVHGHAKEDGGRVPGNPFLENALETVLPEYEKEVKEAVKND